MFENSEKTEELLNYQIPVEWRDVVRIRTLYPPIPKNTGNINFDIYDFDMLFNDTATKELIRTGKTIGCFYIESPGMRSQGTTGDLVPESPGQRPHRPMPGLRKSRKL